MDAVPVPRDRVLDAAMRLVERDGVEGLTMRRLAAELGVAPTAIYWHVGNREQLIGALVDRMLGEFGHLRPRGRSPATRVVSLLRSLRARLLGQPHLVGLVNEHGRVAAMFLPAQSALARELVAAGLPPAKVALTLRVLLFHVSGFVLLELNVARQPEQHPTAAELWQDVDDPAIPAAVVRRLGGPYDPDEVFEYGTRALVERMLSGGAVSSSAPRR